MADTDTDTNTSIINKIKEDFDVIKPFLTKEEKSDNKKRFFKYNVLMSFMPYLIDGFKAAIRHVYKNYGYGAHNYLNYLFEMDYKANKEIQRKSEFYGIHIYDQKYIQELERITRNYFKEISEVQSDIVENEIIINFFKEFVTYIDMSITVLEDKETKDITLTEIKNIHIRYFYYITRIIVKELKDVKNIIDTKQDYISRYIEWIKNINTSRADDLKKELDKTIRPWNDLLDSILILYFYNEDNYETKIDNINDHNFFDYHSFTVQFNGYFLFQYHTEWEKNKSLIDYGKDVLVNKNTHYEVVYPTDEKSYKTFFEQINQINDEMINKWKTANKIKIKLNYLLYIVELLNLTGKIINSHPPDYLKKITDKNYSNWLYSKKIQNMLKNDKISDEIDNCLEFLNTIDHLIIRIKELLKIDDGSSELWEEAELKKIKQILETMNTGVSIIINVNNIFNNNPKNPLNYLNFKETDFETYEFQQKEKKAKLEANKEALQKADGKFKEAESKIEIATTDVIEAKKLVKQEKENVRIAKADISQKGFRSSKAIKRRINKLREAEALLKAAEAILQDAQEEVQFATYDKTEAEKELNKSEELLKFGNFVTIKK